jgi:hypothetical protein
MPGYAGRVRQRDGVVSTEYYRDGACSAGLVHRLLEALQRQLGIPRGHLNVPGVGHLEFDQRIDSER